MKQTIVNNLLPSTMRIVFSTLPPAFSREYIIRLCLKEYETYVVTHPSLPDKTVLVKMGDSTLVEEARTQAYFYEQAQQSPEAPRVPKVYEVFGSRNCYTYLVMEHIPAPSFDKLIKEASSSAEADFLRETAITKIAEAVEWLHNCPVPEGDSIGPVGGGTIQHLFFCMEHAPVAFVNTGALEVYVNKALSILPGKTKPQVQITDEPRLYSTSNITLENFLWDGEVVSFVDWQFANLLPHSFASYYFHGADLKFEAEISRRISLQRSTKVDLIERASCMVIMGGISPWGIDKYGRRRSRQDRTPSGIALPRSRPT